jgi:hypothetical protein
MVFRPRSPTAVDDGEIRSDQKVNSDQEIILKGSAVEKQIKRG